MEYPLKLRFTIYIRKEGLYTLKVFICTSRVMDLVFMRLNLNFIYEYERQELAPRRGLAPPVLIFQTKPRSKG